MDSDPLAPHSGPARGRFGGSQLSYAPSRRTFSPSSPRFGPACRRFGGGCRPFRPTPTRYNRSRPAFRTAFVDSKGPRNPFSRSRHPFRLGLTLPHGPSLTDPPPLIASVCPAPKQPACRNAFIPIRSSPSTLWAHDYLTTKDPAGSVHPDVVGVQWGWRHRSTVREGWAASRKIRGRAGRAPLPTTPGCTLLDPPSHWRLASRSALGFPSTRSPPVMNAHPHPLSRREFAHPTPPRRVRTEVIGCGSVSNAHLPVKDQ